MKRLLLLLSCAATFFLLTTTFSCSRGYGCPSLDQKPKSEKAAKRGGKSKLFPKGVYRN